MNIPPYARYDYCYHKAYEFLEKYNISSFPIDVESIISQSNWALIPYSELARNFNCDINTVIRCLKSLDGYTQWDNTNYSIAYNDTKTLGNRIRFTLMHEVGHIYLNHLQDFEATTLYRGSLTTLEYKVLENEANAFARNVLAPVSILHQLKEKTPDKVSQVFGLSTNASITRMSFYEKDLNWYRNTGMINRLFNVFRKFYYKKLCTNCGYGVIKKDLQFCPICGSNKIKWGDIRMKYENDIILDERSKAKKCPVCDNEYVLEEGEFCHICGTNLVNRCINISNHSYNENDCGALATSNARYCIYCGSETTYYQQEILKDYKIEYTGSPIESMDNPFDIDEELPFN